MLGLYWGRDVEAAGPFGHGLGRREELASTQPTPSKEQGETKVLKCVIPSRQMHHFLNSSALSFSAQSLSSSDYLGFGTGGRFCSKEKKLRRAVI